jgi:hypothetical protein
VLICYPNVSRPPETAFDRAVLDALQDGLRGTSTVRSEAIAPDAADSTIGTLIRTSRAEIVIALGNRVTELVQAAGIPDVSILSGAAALPVPARGLGGISTFVDPHSMCRILHGIAPGARRIVLVHSPRDAWFVRLASDAAAEAGIAVTGVLAKTASEAAVAYLEHLRSMTPGRDCLWLLSDSEILPTDLVQAVIEQAWASSILVFSSVLAHVAQGALFGTFPDPRSIGRRLAKLARGPASAFALDREPGTAINVRTATHLITQIDPRHLGDFALRFGER